MMARPIPLPRSLRRFGRDESGVALVEFAMVLPMMLLIFAVIVEGSRMMMSYQAAITGVRDATRYMARMLDTNLCATNVSVAGHAPQLLGLVRDGVAGTTGFAQGVTVDAVAPSYVCVNGSYRNGPVPVAQLTATVTLTFSFSGLFQLVGSDLATITTTVTDHARVFGS